MQKKIIGMIFAILALVFVIIGLVGSWYNVHMEYSSSYMTGESDSDIYLTRMTAKSTMGGSTQEQDMSIDEIRDQYEAGGMDTSFLDAINNTFIITIIALIFAIIALVFAGLSFKIFHLGKIGAILLILVFVFALISPILFMTGFQSFIDQQMETYSGMTTGVEDIGFWYSNSGEGFNMSLGPGYAWYLMIIGAIFALVAAIIFFIGKKLQAIPTPNVMQQQAPPSPPVSPPTQ